MRYFIVSYAVMYEGREWAFGSFHFENNHYPSAKRIGELIKKKHGRRIVDSAILSIQELTEQDYNDWNKAD